MTLRELMEERGLELADVHAILEEHRITSSKGGRPVTLRGVQSRLGRTIPPKWAEALGVEPEPEPELGDSGARDEKPPRRPAGAKEAVLVGPGASKRIAGAYRFVGAALAAGAGSEGVAEVWGDQADTIAELWVQAAEDNPWAARFVNLMQAGGTTGDLAAAHLYLAGATFYVLGAGIPGGDAIFAKYTRHRRIVVPAAQPGRADTAGNGTAPEPGAPEPAESPLGDPRP